MEIICSKLTADRKVASHVPTVQIRTRRLRGERRGWGGQRCAVVTQPSQDRPAILRDGQSAWLLAEGNSTQGFGWRAQE